MNSIETLWPLGKETEELEVGKMEENLLLSQQTWCVAPEYKNPNIFI